MVPPPKNAIRGVQVVFPSVRNQTAMRVQVDGYERQFRPRGKGRAWEDRTEKSKQKTMQRINTKQPSQRDRDLAAARRAAAMNAYAFQ